MTDKRQLLADAREKLEQAKMILEAAHADQQQFIDSMAESLKHGRRGQDAEASLKALQEAIDQVQEAVDRLDIANK
jgi:cellobiose-specific phosphotransferase system component IIA